MTRTSEMTDEIRSHTLLVVARMLDMEEVTVVVRRERESVQEFRAKSGDKLTPVKVEIEAMFLLGQVPKL